MPPGGFEPGIPANEEPHSHALDRAAIILYLLPHHHNHYYHLFIIILFLVNI